MSFSVFQPCSDLIYILHAYLHTVYNLPPYCSIHMWSTIRILVMFSANNCSPTNGTSLTSWWPFLVHLFHDRANVLVPRMSGDRWKWAPLRAALNPKDLCPIESIFLYISVVNHLRLATSSKKLSIVPLITIFIKKLSTIPRLRPSCLRFVLISFLNGQTCRPITCHCMICLPKQGEKWNWIKRWLNHYFYLLSLQHLEKGWLLGCCSITPLKTKVFFHCHLFVFQDVISSSQLAAPGRKTWTSQLNSWLQTGQNGPRWYPEFAKCS